MDVFLLGQIIDKIVFLLYTFNHYFEGADWSRNILCGAQWPPLTKVDDQLNMLEVKKDIFKRGKHSCGILYSLTSKKVQHKGKLV